MPTKNEQKAQQEFHDQKLQPLLDEAKQGKRTLLFVDAPSGTGYAPRPKGLKGCRKDKGCVSATRDKRHERDEYTERYGLCTPSQTFGIWQMIKMVFVTPQHQGKRYGRDKNPVRLMSGK